MTGFTRCIAIALLGFVAWPTSADVWQVSDCSPVDETASRHHRSSLQDLKAGDAGFIPHPYPRTKQEVVEDFLSFHRRAFADTPSEQLPPGDRRLFAAVDTHDVRYSLHRVANWTPSRCTRHGKDFYFVVQVFDRETGAEITRFAVSQDGSVAEVVHRQTQPGLEHDLPPLPALAGSVASPTDGQQAQYVTVWGTLHCGTLTPCIALRRGAASFLRRESETYALELEHPGFSIRRDMADPRAKQELLRRFEKGPERLVTVGGDRMVLAIRVAR